VQKVDAIMIFNFQQSTPKSENGHHKVLPPGGGGENVETREMWKCQSNKHNHRADERELQENVIDG